MRQAVHRDSDDTRGSENSSCRPEFLPIKHSFPTYLDPVFVLKEAIFIGCLESVPVIRRTPVWW
jgi:hypothetical protein